MKKLNNFMFFAENDDEFESFLQNFIDDYIDTITYLKYLSTDNSIKLFELISSKLELLDKNNIAINFEEIKKMLGLKSKFVIEVESNENSNSLEIDEASITLSKPQADHICSQIHDELLKNILPLYGEIQL